MIREEAQLGSFSRPATVGPAGGAVEGASLALSTTGGAGIVVRAPELPVDVRLVIVVHVGHCTGRVVGLSLVVVGIVSGFAKEEGSQLLLCLDSGAPAVRVVTVLIVLVLIYVVSLVVACAVVVEVPVHVVHVAGLNLEGAYSQGAGGVLHPSPSRSHAALHPAARCVPHDNVQFDCDVLNALEEIILGRVDLHESLSCPLILSCQVEFPHGLPESQVRATTSRSRGRCCRFRGKPVPNFEVFVSSFVCENNFEHDWPNALGLLPRPGGGEEVGHFFLAEDRVAHLGSQACRIIVDITKITLSFLSLLEPFLMRTSRCLVCIRPT